MAENPSGAMYLEINGQFPLDSSHVYLMGKDLSRTKEHDVKFINLKDVDDVDQKHCILEVGVSDVYIFDLLSSNGTYLNNERLKPLERQQLKNGDELTVGKQQVKFCHERPHMSQESSGFLEVNKNTSNMIFSSPESLSQREISIKRLNKNNSLIPSLTTQKLSTPNTSLFIPETEVNTSKVSLNGIVNSRKSDSFTIPETQYCKPRVSVNASNLSITESIPDVNLSKNKFDFNLDDDEFCIPETQDVLEDAISCSQRPRLLTVSNKLKERSILEERTLDLDHDDSVNASQFRISTLDYNEGFGEEADSLISQIIPIIKHDNVMLNNTLKGGNAIKMDPSKLAAENDKEISALKWASLNTDQDTTDIRGNCSTPDIFDFDNINHVASPISTKKQTEFTKDSDINKNGLEPTPPVLEDEEDLMPTQVFPSTNAKSLAAEKKILIEKEQPCLEQEKEYTLTLSDKENRHPEDLEPIPDLPPTQLFAKNDVYASASTPLCKSTASKAEASLNLNPSTSAAALINNNLKHFPNFDLDDEDDLLTQAFLQPSKPPLTTTTLTYPSENSFNSTLLDGKMLNKNPATFFAETEKTHLKPHSTPPMANTFKIPELEMSSLKKNSSTTCTASESDLDLLMCTPQLIKDHMQVSKNDDLKRLMATKHKHLFGDDTDEDADESKKKETYLVELINVPKDTKDFDKLLPHLNNTQSRATRKSTLTEEHKASIEAYKNYKFNMSFGHDHEANKSMNTSVISTTLSRDERHAARNKEKEFTELISKHSNEEKALKESSSRKFKAAGDKEASKPEKVTKSGKRQQSTETASKHKSQEIKKSKITKSEKTEKNSVKIEAKQRQGRLTTRLKSKLDENPSTSKEALAKKNSNYHTDDHDIISTQPFVRSTRSRSNSKQSDSQESVTSKKSADKTVNKRTHQTHTSENNSSSSINSALNGCAKKTRPEHKRKAETHTHLPTERKRLRRTSSHDLSTPHSTTSASSSSMILISMTMVEPQLFMELAKHSAGLWSVAPNPADSEILVMDKANRTFKFFLAMARGIPIVNSNWLKHINEVKSLKKATTNDYLLSDILFEKKHKFSFKKSLNLANSKRLFEGYEFLMTSGITPNTMEIKAIVEAAGGNVHLKSPPPARSDQKIYLVSCVNDKKHWHTFRRLNKNIVIISTEAIMSAVMRQSCLPLSNQKNLLA